MARESLLNKRLLEATRQGKLRLVKEIIQSKADVNCIDLDDIEEKTPLHIAVNNDMVDIASCLLDCKAELFAKSKVTFFGRSKPMRSLTTPLHVAAKKGNLNMVKLLLDSKSNVNEKNGDGDTALHIAAGYGMDESTKLLISAKADIEAKTKEQWVPLHIAARNNYTITCKLILDQKASTSLKDYEGWTPLHYATNTGQAEATKLLVSYKADLNITNNHGETPLKLADSTIVKLLSELSRASSSSVSLPVRAPLQKLLPSQALDSGTPLVISVARRSINDKGLEFIPIKIPQVQPPKPVSQLLSLSHAIAVNTPTSDRKASPSTKFSLGSLSSEGEILLNITVPASALVYKKLLGEGTFGSVYEGLWNDKKVAIKRLKSQFLTDKAIEELRQEAQVMFRLGLESDYIVPLKKICLEKPHYALVMELMSKGSLYHLLHNNQPLPWSIRFQIALDAASGLKDLHACHILHCDLKSLNILLNDSLRAKLADFGLAKVKTETHSHSTSVQGKLGTELWMAPELFDDAPKLTKASDVYSFGMVLWELVTRELPYAKAPSYRVAIRWIEKGKKEEIPSDCPIELKKIITSCWDSPTKRPTAVQLVEQLKPLIIKEGSELLMSTPAPLPPGLPKKVPVVSVESNSQVIRDQWQRSFVDLEKWQLQADELDQKPSDILTELPKREEEKSKDDYAKLKKALAKCKNLEFFIQRSKEKIIIKLKDKIKDSENEKLKNAGESVKDAISYAISDPYKINFDQQNWMLSIEASARVLDEIERMLKYYGHEFFPPSVQSGGTTFFKFPKSNDKQSPIHVSEEQVLVCKIQ